MQVDLVIPMIFPNERWLAQASKALTRRGEDLAVSPRYVSSGLEQQQVLLCWKHMPWLRKIFIILAEESQVQPWMIETTCDIIFHRDFIPEQHLPTFNSTTIEMFLPRIKQLGEYFIYANDDMFPLRGLSIIDFFDGQGMPRQHVVSREDRRLPLSWYASVCRNALCLAWRDLYETLSPFGYLTPQHGMNPMMKSVCNSELNDKWVLINRHCTRFRNEANLIQYFYCFAMQRRGYASDSERKTRYIGTDPGKYAQHYQTQAALKEAVKGYDILCANVTDSDPHRALFEKELHDFITELASGL